MDDTLDSFADFFEHTVENSVDLDVWDPIFLSQEMADDKRRCTSVYQPLIEDISDDENVLQKCNHDEVPDENLRLKSIGMDECIIVPGGYYFNGVWCPHDLVHAVNLDNLSSVSQ